MIPGHYCRTLAEYVTSVELALRPTAFVLPADDMLSKDPPELKSKFLASPFAPRSQFIKEQSEADPRPHTVCTVQSFRNSNSGQ